LGLTGCGGGGGETPANGGTGGQAPDVPQWPQTLEFRDFTGGKSQLEISSSIHIQSGCNTCLTLYGVAQSSAEMETLLPGWKTYSDWPAPYNGKLFSELPLDYNTKTAVVLEDLFSSRLYQYSVQKVEESAATVTITMIKCTGYSLYLEGRTYMFGLLIPKTSKPIQILTVQSGKPPPVYAPNGLGAC
jgi:hypothetical protein